VALENVENCVFGQFGRGRPRDIDWDLANGAKTLFSRKLALNLQRMSVPTHHLNRHRTALPTRTNTFRMPRPMPLLSGSPLLLSNPGLCRLSRKYQTLGQPLPPINSGTATAARILHGSRFWQNWKDINGELSPCLCQHVPTKPGNRGGQQEGVEDVQHPPEAGHPGTGILAPGVPLQQRLRQISHHAKTPHK
jgi:hypothetical protein